MANIRCLHASSSCCSPYPSRTPAWAVQGASSSAALGPLPARRRPRPSSAPMQAAAGDQPGPSSKDAILARIAAAKQYKQDGGAAAPFSSPSEQQPPNTSTNSSRTESSTASQLPASSSSITAPPAAQPQAPAQQGAYSALLEQLASTNPNELDSELSTGRSKQPPGRPDFYTSPDAPGTQQLLSSTPQRRGGGSADEPADWLKGVMAAEEAQGLSPDMRAEEFTAAKEQRIKALGAEIITADPDYRPEGQSVERYKPKVSTWGMFPRPNNISEAYGGGRTIRPGQEVETQEQKAKREAEYAAALQKYKKAVGLGEVDPADEKAAQAAYNAGMEQFRRGQLRQAFEQFNKASSLVPLRSKLGGMATLQAALCLDSLGANKDAEVLYKKLRGHPTAEVAKKAKQLVFGFEAMNFLKTQNVSYAVDKKAWDPYFRRFADASRVYVPTDEERERDAQQARLSAIVAAAVVLGPIILVATLAAQP